MRRIPCPQRAIDRSLSSPKLLRYQSPFSPCHRPASPYPLLRTTHASFSTTPKYSFLLGKQDKKKHQQLVRRWQKRLLGESEPIGAHVDPFDPTSPVRIAPEDQGDEVEVLADEGSSGLDHLYEEEVHGERLRHVGNKKWVDQLEEGKLAKEYEKLTMRTYTPLTHKMADQVEDLTGTMYTLRDDNLMMAQKFHDFSDKPYTNWSFGRATPIRDLPTIRRHFHRAVIEIHALKAGRKSLDITQQANRGVYDVPRWLDEVQLLRTKRGRQVLSFPEQQGVQELLAAMQGIPEWKIEQDAGEDVDAADAVEESVVEEPVPQMDPNTPAFKRTAVVTRDPNQKSFDFMSNRPVPRTLPQDAVADTVVKSEETLSAEAEVPPATSAPIVDAAADSGSKENTGLKTPKIKTKTLSREEVKWRDMPLNDDRVKFALTKRVSQLTGLHISDPTLTSVTTFGELYQHFCAAAKPKPAKLFSYLHIVGQHQAEAAKAEVATRKTKVEKKSVTQHASKPLPRTKSDLATLLKLRNVEILRKKRNAKELRTRRGLSKVITRELRRTGMGLRPSQGGYKAMAKERWYVRQETKPIEGTSVAPSFGVAVSPTAAQLLKDRTQKKRQEWFESQDKSWKEVDMLIRERKFAPVEAKSSL